MKLVPIGAGQAGYAYLILRAEPIESPNRIYL